MHVYIYDSKSHSVVSNSLCFHGLYSLWNSQGQNTRVGSHSLLHGDLPNPGIKPRSLSLRVDSLPAEPQGKPKNTGVDRLSLLQGIFPTQELNQGLLHCRQILYQLNHQGSPRILEWIDYPFSSGYSWPRNQTRVSRITAAAAKSLQSCQTLCDPIDSSPPGSPVPGILQARTLEWVAISFSNAWKSKVKMKSLSRVWPSATPWTAAYQAPPSIGFSRQEYWSGVPLPSPSCITGGFFTTWATREAAVQRQQ